jgi:hypothetical protein
VSARALATFLSEVSPRLLQELAEGGALGGVAESAAAPEWRAVALHAVIRGVVAEDDRSGENADLVDELHDLVLPSFAPASEQGALRAHLARRYGEYDGIARTRGRKDAAAVPAAIAKACARHIGIPDATVFVAAATPLLEALAEGAAAVLAEAGAPGLELPPIEPLRRITELLDAAGIEWGVGASGLLASLGLVDRVNDWDVQVEAEPDVVRALFTGLSYEFHGHGGCHADWKLAFAQQRTEVIPRFAFFAPAGIVHVRLSVSRHWRGLPIASPEGWACAYWLMGEFDVPALRARRAARAEMLFAHLERVGADPARTAAMLAEPLPEPLAIRLRALLPRG